MARTQQGGISIEQISPSKIKITCEQQEIQIPDNEFSTYKNLKIVHIPNDKQLIKIGNKAFCGTMLEKIVIDGNAESEESEGLVIPKTVTEIGANAFDGCPFKELTIYDTLKEIGENAFYCTNLNNVTVKNARTEEVIKTIKIKSQNNTISLFDTEKANPTELIKNACASRENVVVLEDLNAKNNQKAATRTQRNANNQRGLGCFKGCCK